MRRTLRPSLGAPYIPIFALAVVVALLAALPAAAQVASEIEAARAYLQADRQEIVARALELSDSEAAAFWPLYRSYRQEMAGVGDMILKILKTYATNIDTLSDGLANALVDDALKAQQQELKIKKAYVGKFRKVLPGTKVARFYQIENKVDALLKVELAAGVPLVR